MSRFFVLLFSAMLIATTFTGLRSDAHAMADEAGHGEMTYLIIEFHVAEERLEDFLPIMTGINAGMAGEEGFIDAVVYRDNDDPLTFTLIEKWQTRAFHRAHYDRIVELGDWADILTMLTETPVLRYASKL